MGGAAGPPFFCPQDLKPGNLAVNEDCELKVCVGWALSPPVHLPVALGPQAQAEGPDPSHPGQGRHWMQGDMGLTPLPH